MNRVARVALAIALAGWAGCGACKEDKPNPPPATDQRSATIPAGSAKPGGHPGRTPTFPGPGSGSAVTPTPTAIVTKLTLDEALPALPAIPGAVVIDKPTEAPQGAQVHLAWCITAADQRLALAAIQQGLMDSGWVDLRDRGQGARIAITADKPPYRMSVSISASPRPGCSPADGKWFASTQMYKLQAVKQPPLDGVEP